MTTSSSQQVVFIDSRVPDIQGLLNGLQPGVQAFVLDSSSDGLPQIADILTANDLTDLASISVVSHGATAELEIGSSLITEANLSNNSSALAAIGASLASGGAIQLFGCDVALSPTGQQFINDFSTLAGGVLVEASTHNIGLTASGENWALDGSTGPSAVPANVPFTAQAQANFQGQLPVVPPLTAQLFFRINQSNDVQLGDINSDGTSRNSIYFGGGNTSGTPQNIGVFNGNETSVAVDTAAGLVFSVGIGNAGSYDAFSVHNLNTGALISTTEFGANTGDVNFDDVVQALAIDPFTDTLYVGDWGVDAASTGVREFTYNPTNGALTPVATNGGYLFTASQVSSYVNANAFYLDTTHNLLYYVNDDSGYNFAPFSAVNGVYVVDINNPTSATELTSNGNGVGQFPPADQSLSGHDQFIGPNGSLLGLAVDVADGIVFFESTDNPNSSNNALWWVSASGGANQTAHQVTLPAGVTLNFAGQTNEGGDAAGLTFDAQTGNLYLSNPYEDGVQHNLGSIYILHWDNGTQTVSSVGSFDVATLVGTSPATVDPFSAPSATALDDLPVLTTSGTTNHAGEQGAAVTLLSVVPTITDTDGDHLSSATVRITGGTFSSNENSTADDHLTIDSAHRTGNDTSGTINGTSISYSYDSATEKLTLTGYDTLTDYQTALSYVQYFTTGDNPTNYGNNNSRTITWHVSDGAVGDPSGPNTTTTTLNIDAVNDPPNVTVGGGDSASIAVNETNSGINQSRSLTINDQDSLTETLTLTGFSHTGPTGGLSDATLEGFFSVPPTVNITGVTGFNWTFNSGAQAFDFLAAGQTLTLNYTIHDVDSDDTGSPANPLTDDQAISVTITGTNDAPAVAAGNTLAYTENDPATTISPAATVTDADSANFNGGSLTVAFTANGTAADQLTIFNQGTAAGQIGVSGNTVTYGGLTIGTFSGGTNGTNLVVTFTTTDATPAAAQALLDDIQYTNSSNDPSGATRTVTYSIVDGDGGTDTGTATATINFTADNDAPTMIVPASLSGTPNTPVTINGITFSDVDGEGGAEQAQFTATAGNVFNATSGGGVTVTGDGTNSLFLTGSTTDLTNFISGNNLTFTAPSSDTIHVILNDQGHTPAPAKDSGILNIDVNLDAPPVLANAGNTVSYTEQQTTPAAIPVDSAITLTDSDAPVPPNQINSATVKITSGAFAGDLLAADTSSTSILAVWNGTDTLTLTGPDTIAHFQQVLQSVTYTSSSDDPTNGGTDLSRTITWTANDNFDTPSSPVTTTINVTAVNDGPVATITPTSYSATEQSSLDLKNSLSVSDVDGNSGSETVTLSVGEGVLTVTAGTSGVASVIGSGTNTVTIGGTAAQINALLTTDGASTVSYIDNSDTPGASTILSLQINDNGNTGGGSLPAQDTATINITAVNDLPVLNGLGDVSSYTENGSSVILDTNSNASVSDAELNVSPNNFAGATLTLARNGGANPDDAFAGTGTLDLADAGVGGNVSLDGGATFIGTATNPGDGSFSITFNANATAANIASVMHQIIYSNNSDNPPASVQIDWTFSDGNGQSGGQDQGTGATPGFATGSTTVNVTQVDDPPALLNVAVAASYGIGSAGVDLSPGLQAFDPDAAPPSPIKLASATIKIASGFLAGDQLFVNLPTDGSGHFITPDTGTTDIVVQSNAGGQLVLSGSGDPSDGQSVLAYQEVLEAVSYRSTAADPTNGGADTTRTITWQLSDGVLDNQAPSPPLYPETTLGFNNPPSVDLDGSTAGNNYVTTFTENGAPLAIVAASVSVTDPDDANISQATIVLTNAKPGDALFVAGALPGGISSSIDTSVAGQITIHLVDSATLAEYQTALGQIRFLNASDNPDPTDRDITVQVTNSEDSNVAHATVHVIPVNDAPVLSNVAASILVPPGQTVTLSPGLTVSDPDNVNLVGATATVTGGAGDVLAANTGGTNITASYNAATETLTLSGSDTLAHYQSVLDSVTFHSTLTNQTRSVTWVANDGSAANNLSSPVTTTVQLAANVQNDFNGDGKSDLLLQNQAIGNSSVMIDLMNGVNIASSSTIADFSGSQVVATGDFNHDTKADILLQDVSNGTPQIWLMNGANVTGTATLPAPGSAWHVIATGDFNADGNADILWQHNSGLPAIWEMNGTSIMQASALLDPGPGWGIIGAGDFNGDGKADILWQSSSGLPAIWEMNGTSIMQASALPDPGAGWRVIGAGDFNGDGNADILWQNSNGLPAIWEMNGTSIIQAGPLPNPGTSWHAIGTSDVNGDGKADILWQNTDGTAAVWEMNGLSIVAAGAVTNPGANWQLKDDGPIATDETAGAGATASSGQPTATLYQSTLDPAGRDMHLSATDWIGSNAGLVGNKPDATPLSAGGRSFPA